MAVVSRSYRIMNELQPLCMPPWLLALAPWLVGSIMLALLVLLVVFYWRDARARQREQPSNAEGALFIGLVILSVITVVFFAVVAFLSVAGACLSVPAAFPGETSLPTSRSAGTIALSSGALTGARYPPDATNPCICHRQ